MRKKKNGYSSNKKFIYGSGFGECEGAGFMDTLKYIGSYVSQNKDLIAKPLLGAVGNLAAAGLTEGGKALLNRLMVSKKKSTAQLDAKSQEILQSIINEHIPVTNVIGSGARGSRLGVEPSAQNRRYQTRGAGIKKI